MNLLQLWLPILVTAIGVFVASSIIHMAFKWHNSEYKPLPNDDAVRTALNAVPMKPGLYSTPHCVDMKEMQSEDMQRKMKRRPSGSHHFTCAVITCDGEMAGTMVLVKSRHRCTPVAC